MGNILVEIFLNFYSGKIECIFDKKILMNCNFKRIDIFLFKDWIIYGFGFLYFNYFL